VPGLDKLVEGGVFAGSTTLLLGMTGAGKTTIALQFAIEGVKRGEPAIFVNFQENPAQLRRAIVGLGEDPDEMQVKGLNLIYASPVELQIDSIVGEIFNAIESGTVRRLVIDAIGDLATAASDVQRLHDYLYSLIQHFAVRGVTTILTLEVGDESLGGLGTDLRFSYMSDNLIHLAWSKKKVDQRTMRIVKMRGSSHEQGIRDFEIDASGARL
jgi:circadian clock protein KaiC